MSKSAEQIPDDIKKLSFEAALSALEEIVTRLEAGEINSASVPSANTRGITSKSCAALTVNVMLPSACRWTCCSGCQGSSVTHGAA